MALRGKKEEEKKEETVQEPAAETQAPSPEEEKTAVATRAATAVSARPSGVFISNEMMVETAAEAGYGDFTSVTANNGTHMTTTKDDLGKIIQFQAIFAKDVKKVIPGTKDEESKEFFQVSEDGEFVGDGRTLQEALDDAIDAGYNRAKIKDYIDVVCLITKSDNDDFIGEVVTLQLAPTSCFSWRPLASKCKMKAAMGKLKSHPVGDTGDSAVLFQSEATPDSWEGNDYTKMIFTIVD